MKIAVIGAGGVGGYFGGLLAQAGHEVVLVARGAHLAALQANGLQVHSVHGDFIIKDIQATDDPASIGPVDYAILGLKHYQLSGVAPGLRPLVGKGTTVVPLLNGVDAHEVLIDALGPGPVVGGLCSLVSMIDAPGVIRQPSQLRRVVVGELDHQPSARVERLVEAWRSLGVDSVQPENIHTAMWTKFLFITSFSGVGALSRSAAGEIRADPETRRLLTSACLEVRRLAEAVGVPLSPTVVEDTLKLVDSLEPHATSSMQRDVEAGKMFELEAFNGTIVRLGRAAGVPTPVHEAIYGLLRPVLARAEAVAAQRSLT